MTDKPDANEDSETVKNHRALQNQGSTKPSRYPKEKTAQYRELTKTGEEKRDES